MSGAKIRESKMFNKRLLLEFIQNQGHCIKRMGVLVIVELKGKGENKIIKMRREPTNFYNFIFDINK